LRSLFNEGHGNIIQSFGYISSFLGGENPRKTSPAWIKDNAAAPPPPPIPALLPKSAIRGEDLQGN